MATTEPEPLDDLTRMADELVEQAAQLRRGWEELEAMVRELAPAVPADPHADTETPGAESEADPRLLIALDMALAGRSREETGAYLRESFGPDGADEILAEVYERR